MLCIWWDWKEIVHYKLLQRGETINSVLFYTQLDSLNETIQKEPPELANRKGVVFHHDNARPHTPLMTRNKLTSLGLEVLMHTQYSPDLSPFDYHLFRALQNSLDGKKFADRDSTSNHLANFFDNKPQRFYNDGIMQLSEK